MERSYLGEPLGGLTARIMASRTPQTTTAPEATGTRSALNESEPLPQEQGMIQGVEKKL